MVARGVDMEALSPRDANAQRMPARANELKTKAAAGLKSAKDKEHPPPPPNNVIEPSSSDRKEGAVYQVGKLLGKGGFAICYDGKLAGSSKRYALKIVKSQMPTKMEQKFQTELQIHSKMRQQNIVQFHRAFTFENCTYLVLELCPNGSLMDMVKRRKGLTEPEVRFYTVQIAGAIKYMHAKGIIHRDLKMGNIFLDKYMNAKIGDFGLAALLLTGKDMQVMRRTTLCGTPNYIAPEILEKGKKGHDHMVDIWSLGIIVFAMLTSKPPFQSSTTDEIYRRARDRDYDWPSPETSQKYISQEVKDLVATMLQDATRRPDPDTIVEHPFFMSGYMPLSSDMTSKLRECAPQNPAFYDSPADAQSEELNIRNVKEMCRQCNVGPWCQSQLVSKKIWREMAEEEHNGLTPAIPLAEGIVYRPFDEIKIEQQLQEKLLQERAAAQQAQQSFQLGDRSDEISSFNHSTAAQRAPSGLLRAPPQSFAAQQRAQNRPTNTATLPRSQTATDTGLRTSGSLRLRSMREVSGTERQAQEDPAPSLRTTRSLRSQPTRGQAKTIEEEPVQLRAQTAMVSRPKPQQESVSLFSPSEYQELVPGSQPDAVLDRLCKLQAELERALNARSMAILSKDRTPSPPHIVVKWVDYTNKFGLGYILNDGSVGCILRNIPTIEGSRNGILPPACVLVHGAERHCQRREDPRYPDRHQIVPMNEGIYFYENNNEDGFSRVRVSPENFRLPMNPDGTIGKLSVGTDIYDHRKRERIVLWKKFANYMIAYGREIEGQVEESSIRVPTITDPTAAPSDVVTFYQRFGDVGCWMFCDGHMQFNFPDHTKIVIDSTGTWCHFWHLPEDAAKRLEETGSLAESALDDRTVLSYPLQTLLNFAAKQPASRAGTRSASNPTRRRPEISPELQGIPAANHFRRKVEFIRDVIKEWNTNGGIGNSDMTREKRLRWTGIRETRNVPIPAKHVWVTIGARWGDERQSAYVDPRKPSEIGDDIDESAKKRT
ncbi:kinase-like domain-containing protein [Apodospora peruviana]|uniref:Kinase-like domain-containing protein n=1 Tax=Apodospora peruviana TaxID=516989 RepID=A0AAE0IQG8_9PEZI|nr:kinase-like domain-containing protein [Apodospora peruviana]